MLCFFLVCYIYLIYYWITDVSCCFFKGAAITILLLNCVFFCWRDLKTMSNYLPRYKLVQEYRLWNLRSKIFRSGVIFLFLQYTKKDILIFFLPSSLIEEIVSLYNTNSEAHAWRVSRRFILLCNKPSYKNQKKFKFFTKNLGTLQVDHITREGTSKGHNDKVL